MPVLYRIIEGKTQRPASPEQAVAIVQDADRALSIFSNSGEIE
jgi:hypothetical protein